MDICENGKMRELPPSELASMESERQESERQYWLNTPYDEAVDAEIRKRYSVSQEFAILRQATTKPEEYEAYFSYCEACKAYVKAKIEEVST